MKNQSDLLETIALKNVEINPKIYSKTAIWSFSVAFTPLAGGILLRQNLVETGNRKAANMVLISSIFLTLVTLIIVSNTGETIPAFTFILNTIWGGILSQFLFNKYIPLYPLYSFKKIWKPLIVCILISLSLLFLQIVATQ